MSETGWTWDQVRALELRRMWMLFKAWRWRDGGEVAVAAIPPAPTQEEIAAAFARTPILGRA